MKKLFTFNKQLFSNRMSDLRVYEKDWTYVDMAKATGMSASALRKLEICECNDIQMTTLLNISKALECDPFWLLGITDERGQCPIR